MNEMMQTLWIFGLSFVLAHPLALLIHELFRPDPDPTSKKLRTLEGIFYKLARINPELSKPWQTYLRDYLFFNLFTIVFVFVLFVQAETPALQALELSISLITHTHLDFNPKTFPVFPQVFALSIAFVSSISLALAMIRALVAEKSPTVGNFWSDIVRCTLLIELPLLLLIGTGLVIFRPSSAPSELTLDAIRIMSFYGGPAWFDRVFSFLIPMTLLLHLGREARSMKHAYSLILAFAFLAALGKEFLMEQFPHLIFYTLLSVFLSGLLVGRIPEYLGKKIKLKEIRLLLLALIIEVILILSLALLLGDQDSSRLLSTFFAVSDWGTSIPSTLGQSDRSILILSIGMLGGHFLCMIPIFAFTGSMGKKDRHLEIQGVLPVHGWSFCALFLGVLFVTELLLYMPLVFAAWGDFRL